MQLHSITRRAAAVLPLIGIVLALANWNARPTAGLAWAAAIVMFVVMAVARHHSQLVFRRSSGNGPAVRSLAAVTSAVVVGALMMIIPLAATLAHAYGLVDDADGGRRMTMILFGAYFAASGNALPRMLPPVSSMQCNGARIQAFQRFAGWTWAICGTGFATAWMALPIDVAQPVSSALMATAMMVTIVQVVRLRKSQHRASSLH